MDRVQEMRFIMIRKDGVRVTDAGLIAEVEKGMRAAPGRTEVGASPVRAVDVSLLGHAEAE